MKHKVLVVIVNFNFEQVYYLREMVDELKSFKKYDVHIIVHSNVHIEDINFDEIKIFKLPDFQLLPLTCRSTIWQNREDYDLFIFSENDHLILEHHLDKHLEYEMILPDKYITGLIQYEEKNGEIYYPGYHDYFDWDYSSLVEFEGKKFAHFSNVHQASFILTKKQLSDVSKLFDFTDLVDEKLNLLKNCLRRIRILFGLPVEVLNKYSVKCKVNTDVFLFGGKRKLICITDFEENLIHHLPNLYIDGKSGRKKLRSDSERMNEAIAILMSK